MPRSPAKKGRHAGVEPLEGERERAKAGRLWRKALARRRREKGKEGAVGR